MLGAGPMACVLWDRFLQHNPAKPEVFARLRRETDRDDVARHLGEEPEELKHESP